MRIGNLEDLETVWESEKTHVAMGDASAVETLQDIEKGTDTPGSGRRAQLLGLKRGLEATGGLSGHYLHGPTARRRGRLRHDSSYHRLQRLQQSRGILASKVVAEASGCRRQRRWSPLLDWLQEASPPLLESLPSSPSSPSSPPSPLPMAIDGL